MTRGTSSPPDRGGRPVGRVLGHAGRVYAGLPLLLAALALLLAGAGLGIDAVPLGALLAACAAAAVAAWWLGRRMDRSVAVPLEALAETARRLEHGDLSARAGGRGGLETADVARALNSLASELDRLAADLGELDELKSSFMSTVSHELRTPLTSIRGYVELLAEDETGPLNDEQREFVEIITRNAVRLETMISDLLVLSRLESGATRLDSTALDAAPLVKEVVGELHAEAAVRGVEIELAPAEAAVVLADESQLARALECVLVNAVAFSPRGARVGASCGVFGEEVVIEVVDSGPGISSEELPSVTRRFFRGAAARARSTQGTGLGLSIAREVMGRHAGRLELESEEGTGTRVRLSLPHHGARTGPSAADPADPSSIRARPARTGEAL